MTNGDKIRAMSDVSLAMWLTHIEMLVRKKQSSLTPEQIETVWLKWVKEEVKA